MITLYELQRFIAQVKEPIDIVEKNYLKSTVFSFRQNIEDIAKIFNKKFLSDETKAEL